MSVAGATHTPQTRPPGAVPGAPSCAPDPPSCAPDPPSCAPDPRAALPAVVAGRAGFPGTAVPGTTFFHFCCRRPARREQTQPFPPSPASNTRPRGSPPGPLPSPRAPRAPEQSSRSSRRAPRQGSAGTRAGTPQPHCPGCSSPSQGARGPAPTHRPARRPRARRLPSGAFRYASSQPLTPAPPALGKEEAGGERGGERRGRGRVGRGSAGGRGGAGERAPTWAAAG